MKNKRHIAQSDGLLLFLGSLQIYKQYLWSDNQPWWDLESDPRAWRQNIRRRSRQIKEMDADQSKGKERIPVLFEEMDGVWLRM